MTTDRLGKTCLFALAAFQVLIAVLLVLDWDATVASFAGRAFAPTRQAAEGAAFGALVVHGVLALLFALLAVQAPRWRPFATVLLALTFVAGIATLFSIGDATPLNPVGVVLAAAGLVLLWTRRPAHQG